MSRKPGYARVGVPVGGGVVGVLFGPTINAIVMTTLAVSFVAMTPLLV